MGDFKTIAVIFGLGYAKSRSQNKFVQKIVCVLAFLLYFTSAAFSSSVSDSKLDSLRLAVETMPDDSLKCHTLINIAFTLYSGGDAVNYAYRAEKLAKKIKSPRLTARAFTSLAWCLDYDKVDQKTAYLDSALHIFTKLNDYTGLIIVYISKASILQEYNNLEESLANLEIANSYCDKVNDLHRKAIVFNNYANVLIELNKPLEARAKFEEALEFRLNEKPINKIEASRIYFGLGNCAKLLGNYQSSLDYFYKSFVYRQEIKSTGVAESLIGMANTMYEAAEQEHDTLSLFKSINSFGYQSSKAILDSATSIALHNGIPQFIPPINSALRRKAILNGNYKLAYELLMEEKETNEANMLSESSLEGLADLKIKSEKDQLKIKLLEEELNYDRKQNQFNILLYFLGVMILIFVIGLLLFQNRLKAKHIQFTNAKQEQQNIAMRSMLEGQEKERARIARDLHDGLGNLLSTLKVTVANTQKSFIKTNNLEQYHRANKMIDEACSEVRKIAHEMMPQALQRLGLKKALEDQISNIDSNTMLNASFSCYGNERSLSAQSNMMLFRVVQEAINNILHHAEANEVLLQLTYSDDWLNLTIEDDGKGFELSSLSEDEGMGLKSMTFRINSIGGNIDIDSRKGMGTLISINIPLDPILHNSQVLNL